VAPTFADTVCQVAYFFLPAYLANMAPVVVVGRFAWLAGPMDGGRSWRGVRLLGDHKTWRGLLVGVVVGIATFAAQRAAYGMGLLHPLALVDYTALHPLWPGFLLGLGAGVGDAVKSFFKRRVGIRPGASWLGFDQLDFMAGAYLFVSVVVTPPAAAVLAILPGVFLVSVATTAGAYALGLKEAWI
jgi:CDP-2,3-bis-(O-geranylgeranyl)-sn-glycerol synthase